MSTGSSERRAEKKETRLQTEQTRAGTFFMLFPERDEICSLASFLLTVTTSEGFYLPTWFSDSDTLASQVSLHPSPYFFFPVSPFPSPPSPLSTSPIVLLQISPPPILLFFLSCHTQKEGRLPKVRLNLIPPLTPSSPPLGVWISLLTFDLYLQDQRLF